MQVPWEDLCYLFGEIMYGGHITDDWDRRLCQTYLQEFMHPKMVSQSSSSLHCFFVFCFYCINLLKVNFTWSKQNLNIENWITHSNLDSDLCAK